MNRRAFITVLGGAAAWPLAARAQQPAVPVIGFLESRSLDAVADRVRAFHRGLREHGYVDGDNVAIVYRWAENQPARLPDLATELVRRRVAAIALGGGHPVVFATQAATTTIPIIAIFADDPVRHGLVTSLARPGGNLTGVNFLSAELAAKQLEPLRELVPGAARVAVLVNPVSATDESLMRDADAAARAMGMQAQIFRASTSGEIDAAFATFARERPDAVFVATNAFLAGRRVQLVQLAAHHRVPAIYQGREFPEIGGLMSYGSNIADAYRQVGAYTGRVLKGEKPADLPVVQSVRLELVINHQTARMLGLTVPPKLLATADEVIE